METRERTTNSGSGWTMLPIMLVVLCSHEDATPIINSGAPTQYG